MSYSPGVDVPISIFKDQLQMTFTPASGGGNVTTSFVPSQGSTYFYYTLTSASQLISVKYAPDIYSGYLRGFKFNFNFKIVVNKLADFDVSTGVSYLNVYFTDGTYYTVDVSRTTGNSLYFTDALSFREVKQIDSFELKVGFDEFNLANNSCVVKFYPDLSVSQTYFANNDIIDFGADDEEIAGLQDEALGNKEEAAGLLSKDSTPDFTYSAVDIESTDYADSTSFFSSLFENNVISLILPAVIGLVIIKYVLFGRG